MIICKSMPYYANFVNPQKGVRKTFSSNFKFDFIALDIRLFADLSKNRGFVTDNLQLLIFSD